MGFVPKPVRSGAAALFPTPFHLSDLATRWASDLRGFATFGQHPCQAARGAAQNTSSPASWGAMSSAFCGEPDQTGDLKYRMDIQMGPFAGA